MVAVRVWARSALATGFCVLGFGSSAHAQDLTYADDIKPLLDSHCVECHHNGARRPDFSSFPFRRTGDGDDQNEIVERILARAGVSGATMPPGVRPKLSLEEVELIARWRDQGLKP